MTWRPTRRAFVLGGGAALGALAVGCKDSDPASTARTTPETEPGPTSTTTAAPATSLPGSEALTAAAFEGLQPCVLIPEQTEGPFYLADDLTRTDITEGLPGHPLRVGIMVVDESCAPIPGAVVDVWHADVEGDYSGFADGAATDDDGPGSTFLRGTQVTSDEGIVQFRTVYPGWYPGRAVHIHLKAHLDDRTVLTTQLYFDEDRTAEVFAAAPYAAHGSPDTTIAADTIAGDPRAQGNLLTTTPDGDGTIGLVVIGVDPRVR